MEDPLQKILQKFIPLRDQEGQSKVMPLNQALKKFVEPGLTLHLGMAPILPNAIIDELTRVFRGQDPGFILITMG